MGRTPPSTPRACGCSVSPSTGTWHRARLGAACQQFPLLQKAAQAAVGERLAARLAGGAVLQRGGRERHLADGVATLGALLARAAMHAHPRLLLGLEPLGRQA